MALGANIQGRRQYQTPGINDVNLGKPSYGGGTQAAANAAGGGYDQRRRKWLLNRYNPTGTGQDLGNPEGFAPWGAGDGPMPGGVAWAPQSFAGGTQSAATAAAAGQPPQQQLPAYPNPGDVAKYSSPGLGDWNNWGRGKRAAAGQASRQMTPWSEEGIRAGQQPWAINQATGRPWNQDYDGGGNLLRNGRGITPPPPLDGSGYQQNIFDMYPQYSDVMAMDPNKRGLLGRAPLMNEAVYNEWAAKRLGDFYNNTSYNPSMQRARGMPSWWRPGMAPIYSGGQGGGNISTGIDAGPVYGPGTVNASYNQTLNPSTQAATGGVNNPFSQQLSTLQGIYGSQDAAQLARGMAEGNASQSLASQRARAGAGLDWANLGFGDYSSRLRNQATQQNSLLSLLQGMI